MLKTLQTLMLSALVIVPNLAIAADFPFIVASGTQTSQIAPDKATITLNVLGYGKSSDSAMDQAQQGMQAILALLDKYKLDKEHITAKDWRKNVQRARTPDYQAAEVIGYEMTRTVEITLNDISIYPAFAEQLKRINQVQNQYASFDVMKRSEVEKELMQQAVLKAKANAQNMVAPLNMKLARLHAISQGNLMQTELAEFGLVEGGLVQTGQYQEMRMANMAQDQQSFFAPEFIEFSQSVNLVYEIQP